MRRSTTPSALAVVLAGSVLVATAGVASAKTCKEPVTVTTRSTIKTGVDARTRRATDNAEKRWSKEVKEKYGIAYYFWARSDAQKVECRQTEKTTFCTATATPCRVL